MALWSSLRGLTGVAKKAGDVLRTVPVRHSGGGRSDFYITPTRFQWHKFKDMLHFYTMIGMIPVTLIIAYANIFVGPAQLQPIPEGYEPKYWEYHRHPITRFIARYFQSNPQQEYEKFMHFIIEDHEKTQLNKLEIEIKARMAEKLDYQSYYYRPVIGKYLRLYKEDAEKLRDGWGDK